MTETEAERQTAPAGSRGDCCVHCFLVATACCRWLVCVMSSGPRLQTVAGDDPRVELADADKKTAVDAVLNVARYMKDKQCTIL